VAVALVFFVAAIVLSFAMGTPPASRRGAAAAERFIDAWQRKLEGTWLVDATVTRTVAGSGGALVAPLRTVQRPPQRLTFGFGDATGRSADSMFRCPTAPDGTSRCFATGGAPSYAKDVADEMSDLRSYVEDPKPLYTVVDFRDGCYRLDLALRYPAPPYGDHALFCFDDATGAQTTAVVDHGTVIDRTDAKGVHATVTDQDLDVPVDRGQLFAEQGINLTSPTPGAGETTTTTTPSTTTSSPSSTAS
jgi:hypothetical protein